MPSTYQLEKFQFLPISLHDAWDFFSKPDNLAVLTPPNLKMTINNRSGAGEIFPGQIITYRLKPLFGIPVSWVTEITHVSAKSLFVDEQRFGPYRFWHHTHFFKEVEGGTEMRDLVHYKLPFGPLGRLGHHLFVRRQLEQIFTFREAYLKKNYPGSFSFLPK